SGRYPDFSRHDHRDGHARTCTRRAIRPPVCFSRGRQADRQRSGAVKARDLAELAVRNLREALLRNLLTTLGVGVGVASLVAMLSRGVGLRALASERLTRSGLFDAVFVTSPRGLGGPGGGPARASRTKDAKPLDADSRKQLAKIPNVVEVYPQIRFVAQVKFESES